MQSGPGFESTMNANVCDVLVDTQTKKPVEIRDRSIAETVEITPTGYFEYAIPNDKIRWSGLFTTLWEPSGETIIRAQDVLEKMHPEDCLKFKTEYITSLKEHRSGHTRTRVLQEEERVCWLEAHWDHIYARDGTPERSIGMASDITHLRETETRLLQTLAEREMLLQEIHHRVKNNLQILLSMMTLEEISHFEEMEQNPFAKNLFSDMTNRIRAIAQVHESIYLNGDLADIRLDDHLTALMDNTLQNSPTGTQITYDIQAEKKVTLSLNLTIAISLAINEILTNIVKHAFVERKEGTVAITISEEQENVHIRIADNGVGMPDGFDLAKTESVGTSLINGIVTKQLHGSVTVGSERGTIWNITFPRSE